MDPRIRLIKLSVNGGTYNARNAGIRAATGQYITGQDSDDWSHPERIERQVEHLIAEPSSAGVVVEGIRMDNDLIRMFPGRIPQRMCEVSLMLPLQLAREVGGYLKARKGADSEFRRRVEHYVRKKITFLELPLYLIRIGHASLSRADFKPGWSHPVRRAFWNASQHWHETSQPTSLSLENNPQPIPVPNKFKVFAAEGKRQFDVVFIDDGRTYGSRQRSIIDQMLLLSREDFRVGFMHLESILSPSKETTRLSPELQMLINNGIITEVIPDEDASSHVLVISDPTILQFSPSQGIAFTAHQTLLVPDIPQLLEEQGIVLYLPEECEKAARLLFSGDVRWTSSDPLIRDQLATLEQNITVSSTVMPIALNVHQWRNSRERLRGESPVIGRHSENLTFVWPKDELDAHQLWPSEDVAEVRILGDARSYLRKYGEARFPINWIVFRDKEIKPEAFMGAIDFFVYFPDEGLSQSYSREALEAVASGAIAILPPQFRDMHGDLAIYASPQEVQDIIRGFITNKDEYFESVKTDVDVIAERSNGDYLAYIESFGLKKQDQYSNLRKIAFN